MKTEIVHNQASWKLVTKNIKACVTRQGGHLGPVQFRLGKRWIQPFDIAPWAEEKEASSTPQILRVMRGDFFCMPFGGNASPYRGEKYPPHGETANDPWKLEKATPVSLSLSMKTTVRSGWVQKTIGLVPDHAAIYSRHVISGMKGPMCFGHHAILHFKTEGAARISVSPFIHGQVFPGNFENPAAGGYSILKPGATFTKLESVPRSDNSTADLSVYPAREGYEDLVLMGTDPHLPFGWTAATVPSERYVWFALKDPRVLSSTVFWMSNGGRHYAPWSSRHRHAIGLEEVVSNFHLGLAESAKPNELNKVGVKTKIDMDPKRPLAISYIMAMAEVPAGFDRVATIVAGDDKKSVVLTSHSGKKVRSPLDLSFLSL